MTLKTLSDYEAEIARVTVAIAKTNSEYLRRDYGKYKMRLLREVRRLKGRVTS